MLAAFVRFADALAVNYDCTNFPDSFGSATCTGATVSFPNTTNSGVRNTTGINLSNGVTYYVTFDTSGESGTGRMRIEGETNDGAFTNFTGSVVDAVLAPAALPNSVFSNLRIENNSSFTGDIFNICVADAPGECNVVPPIPTGGATSTPDQTQQNLSTAFLLFFVSMFGTIWLIRKH